MEKFVELSKNEKLNTNGGVLVIDDAIFWGLVGTGFAAGIKLGVNRKNRTVEKNEEYCHE